MKYGFWIFAVLIVVGALLYDRVFPSYWSDAPRTPRDDAKIACQVLADAIELYRSEKRRLPARLEDLKDLDVNGEPYTDKSLIDLWGTAYRYRPEGDTQFQLRSAGPDGRFDTNDDIVHGGR